MEDYGDTGTPSAASGLTLVDRSQGLCNRQHKSDCDGDEFVDTPDQPYFCITPPCRHTKVGWQITVRLQNAHEIHFQLSPYFMY